jgi:hypothetical protein
MKKLPKDISHLNLSKEEYERLSTSDKLRIVEELRCNDATFYSEANPDTDADLSVLPCVIDGVLIF